MKKNRSLWMRRAAVTAGSVLVSFLVICAAAFFISRLLGKNSIESVSAGEYIDLPTTEESEELAEGEIRYQGKVYAYNRDIMTFLIMGIDQEGEVETAEDGLDGGQADALFLGIMNPHNKTVSILTINRNTIAAVDVYDEDGIYVGQYMKQICLQHGYGDGRELSCERTVAAVSRLLHGLPINGYVAINMEAIADLNDAVGGVPVTVLDDIVYPEYDMDFHAGDEVVLTGREAYWYVRLRNENVFDSNTLRQNRQKQFLTTFAAMAKQQATSDIRVALDLYQTISDYMVTDIDITRFTYLATEALGYEFNIDQMYTLEGETVMGTQFEEYYVDEDAMEATLVELFYEPAEE